MGTALDMSRTTVSARLFITEKQLMTSDASFSEPPESRPELVTTSSLIYDLQIHSTERWDKFVLLYAPLLKFWIRGRHVPKSDEDDVLQECLTSIAAGLNGFCHDEENSSFRGWLRTIVNRRAADYFRQRDDEPQARPDSLESVPAPDTRTNEEMEAEEAAFRELKMRAMELTRQSTTQRTWEMFWKSAVEQIATSDVAGEYGVSQAAVRVARGRVLCRLRELLIEEPEIG